MAWVASGTAAPSGKELLAALSQGDPAAAQRSQLILMLISLS
jgi:hypothetical protein